MSAVNSVYDNDVAGDGELLSHRSFGGGPFVVSGFRIALTGANGFVGAILAKGLRAAGHRVVPLVRAGPGESEEWIPFSLEKENSPDQFAGFDALIHCAHDFRAYGVRDNRRLNVEGSFRLFDSASSAGVRNLVFISSLSAFPGCRSDYGRGKLSVEEHVTALGGTSIRPGFVYDETYRGLSGRLRALACTFPVIPTPGIGDQKLYPLHGDDLAIATLRILETESPPPVISVAQSIPWTLAGLLRLYARRAGRHLVLIPIPWQPIWGILRGLEMLGTRLSFRSDSLLSLLNQNPSPDFAPMHDLEIKVRPLTR